MAPTSKRRGRKRRRSNNSSSRSITRNQSHNETADTQAKPAGKEPRQNGFKCHYYSTDDEDGGNANNNEIYALDGVEYKNYTDFVLAKRKRNEAFLQTLGFDKNNKKKSSNKKEKKSPKTTKDDSVEKNTRPTTTSERPRIVSPPASSYYARYAGGGISLDGASLRTDPFDRISSLLLELEKEERETMAQPDAEISAVDTSSTKGKKPDVEEATKEKSKTKSKIASNKVILSLLEKLLSFLNPSSDEDPSVREEHVEAFYQLGGVLFVTRLLRESYYKETEDGHRTAELCLQILRDACCLSTFPEATAATTTHSAPERVALALVEHGYGLDIFMDILASYNKRLESDTSQQRAKGTRTFVNGRKRSKGSSGGASEREFPSIDSRSDSQKGMESSNERLPRTLGTLLQIWSIFPNLTYFESVTTSLGNEALLELADKAYHSLALLDYHVTRGLSQILPLPSTQEKPNKTKKSKKGKSNAVVEATPEALQRSKNIAIEASRILVPILGTLRNLVADPLTSAMDWEAKSFVSKLLDIVCKGGDEKKKAQPGSNSNEDLNAWLNFVQQSSKSSIESFNGPPPDPAPPTLFRWMEQSEATVWEVLGIFKVCLGKGLLSTFTNDVERLVSLWIRCLRQYGVFSSRITLRILGMVEGLAFPANGESYGSSSPKAAIRKQILIREGFVRELVDLSERYSFLQTNGSSPSNPETIRVEIDSMISWLRSND